ncbi:MAG: YqaJ viral recombinase family protein [Deltaproteobacteria bacterium]|nr:YqaJ viral recombinase family protein [Deltaproteobacteria bacterium]
MTTMSRDTWLAERKKGIACSELAAILGVSPWESEMDVWSRKRNLVPDTPDNIVFKTGRELEPLVAREYAEMEKVELIEGELIRHPSAPLLGTPDRLIKGMNRGLEIKTVQSPYALDKWGEPGSDQVPLYYATQVAGYLAITGYDSWDLAALFVGSEIRVYRIQRDLELEAEILRRVSEWWTRHIINGEEPAIDGSAACSNYLSQKYQRNTLPLIGANEEAEELLLKLFAMRDQVKSDELVLTELENKLKALIGEAEGIQGICGKALWRKNKDSEKVDWEAVARSLSAPADLIKANTIIKPGPRVFRPTRTTS